MFLNRAKRLNRIKAVLSKHMKAVVVGASILVTVVSILSATQLGRGITAEANSDQNLITVDVKLNRSSRNIDSRTFNVCTNKWSNPNRKTDYSAANTDYKIRVYATYKGKTIKMFERITQKQRGDAVFIDSRKIYDSLSVYTGRLARGVVSTHNATCEVDINSKSYTGRVYQFNFDGNRNILEGHFQDNGESYRLHGNGLSYGWNRDYQGNIENTADNEYTQDPRGHNGIKGYAEFPDSDRSVAWFLGDIPNGSYEVEAIVGTGKYDPNALHHIRANDDTVVICNPTRGTQQWCEGRTRINVTNNLIIVNRGPEGNNVKMNLIRIRELR